jgi:hypothetical protein
MIRDPTLTTGDGCDRVPPMLRSTTPLTVLLAPNFLSVLADDRIDSVEIAPLTTRDGVSGVPIERVVAIGERGRHHFILKRFALRNDWIARATRDHQAREAQLCLAGLAERLPPEVEWPALAVAHDPATEGWALLLSDVTAEPAAALIAPGDEPVATVEVETYLEHLAALHRTFVGEATFAADLPLCDPVDWLTLLGPATIARERGVANPVTPLLEPGWDAFSRQAPAAMRERVMTLLRDPSPLLRAFGDAPKTLLHGDYKFGNLGRRRGAAGPRTIALDWSQTLWAWPTLEIGWFLAVNSARLPLPKERCTEVYREAAGIEAGPTWDRLIDLGLLGGGLLRLAWAKALGAESDNPAVTARERAEVEWRCEAAERALRRLDNV